MRINHNISALNTYRQYNTNTVSANKSMEKLSSGLRINRAADDAAGLSISEKMRSQIRGLTQATRNAQDGVSFIQTAEGALSEVSDMLVRLKELSVQVNNGTYSDVDRANIGKEMNALGNAIKDIYSNTKFNGREVFGSTTLGGSAAAVKSVYTDSAAAVSAPNVTIFGIDVATSETSLNAAAVADWAASAASNAITDNYDVTWDATNNRILATAKVAGAAGSDGPAAPTGGTPVSVTPGVDGTGSTEAAIIYYGESGGQSVTIANATTDNLLALTTLTDAATTGADVAANATNAMLVSVTAVEAAIDEVNTTRADYGAQQNQLEHMSNNMSATKENLQAAESRIRDVDMADEMMEFTKNNILVQAAQAMLAQANSQPQGILQLLR